MDELWECYKTGAGYSCESNAPDRVKITKTPGRGSVTSTKRIHVPDIGGNIEFAADIVTHTWANNITIDIVCEVDGEELRENILTIKRGTNESGAPYVFDISEYANKDIAFVMSNFDDSIYSNNGDHNFVVTLHDFAFIPNALCPTPVCSFTIDG